MKTSANASPSTTPDAGTLTELVFVVDASGSMCGLEDDTIGGLNATLARHRETPGDCVVSVIQFDAASRVIVDRRPIGEVRPLTRADYRPGGCTALLDAMGDAITYTRKVQRYFPKAQRPGRTVYAIITDGQENASQRYGYAQVKRLVEKRRAKGWEFLFLGANIDAAAEADRLGISRGHAARYVADGRGSQLAYKAFANATLDVRCDGCVPAGWADEVAEDAAVRA